MIVLFRIPRSLTAALLLGAAVGLWTARADATICGDPDDNGSVSLTDGVRALRAAAGLPDAGCDPPVCDVDGYGNVSVTDGVRVLRAAAASTRRSCARASHPMHSRAAPPPSSTPR